MPKQRLLIELLYPLPSYRSGLYLRWRRPGTLFAAWLAGVWYGPRRDS